MQQVPVFLMTNYFKFVTSYPWRLTAFRRSSVLQGGKDCETTQRLPSEGRYVSVLFQSFFPISLRASHIAKVALSEITPERKDLGKLSLYLKYDEILLEVLKLLQKLDDEKFRDIHFVDISQGTQPREISTE